MNVDQDLEFDNHRHIHAGQHLVRKMMDTCMQVRILIRIHVIGEKLIELGKIVVV